MGRIFMHEDRNYLFAGIFKLFDFTPLFFAKFAIITRDSYWI